jgi:O-antigen ligase
MGLHEIRMKMNFFTNRQYREEKILNWIAVGFLFFITSFIWAPSRDGVQTVFVLGFLLPLLCVLPFRKPDFLAYGGWFTGLALIFAAYAALTSIWSPVPKTDFFVIQWIVLAVWLSGINWFATQREINLNYLLELLLLSGCFFGLINVLAFYGENSIFSRLNGLFVAHNPNELGVLFGILSLLAYCQWLKSNTLRQSAHYGLLLMCLLVPLFLSQSRGALLALVMTSLIACFYIQMSKQKMAILAGLTILSVLVLVVNWFEVIALVPDRLGSGLRDKIWQEVFSRSVNEHLLLGIGLEKEGRIIVPNVGVFNHAHNVWLDTFYRTGVIGLVLILVHVFYVLQKFKLSEMLTPLYLWLMFGLIASMFDYRGFFWEIDLKWFIYWVPVGLISAMHIQENSFQKKNSQILQVTGDKNGD